ncbi:50S ribosomal protein L10 [Candidatus Pacearchaeota archaeon]|nr:50S ribosomal protein L10 [Candidatus Pacearchaeota archaeon]
MKLQMKKTMREKEIPEYKVKLVSDIAQKIKNAKTVLIASTKNLPSSQFHEIKKNLRGKAEISVAKKSIVIRAIEKSGKAALQPLKETIGADVALFFSDMDPFSLSGLLTDSQSAAKAKAGDIAPEDIHVEPQPTDLVPGPAISELAGVGLKVAVEGGKLAIKQPHTIAKAGDVIKENVASVMAKLGITPMKVGFEPIAAYDADADKVYVGIKIDKKAALDELRDSIKKALGFAINMKIVIKETLSYFLAKAAMEEKAMESLTHKHHSHQEASA